MTDELYLTGVVIANGIPDVDEDVLNAKDIKIIFSKYMNRLTDINHDDVSYYGIEVLANWISETNTTIAGRTVPAKSWLATVKVLNPEIIDLVNRGELRGFSLSSTYVGDVNKSKEENMSEESKFSLGDLKNIFKFKSDLEDNLIEKAAPEEGNAGVGEADKSVEALFEKVDMLLEKVSAIEGALKGEEEPEKESDDSKIEKSEGKEPDDDKIEKSEGKEPNNKIEKSEGKEPDEEDEGEEADDKEIKKSAEEIDTKKIHKGVTSKAHDVPEVPEKTSTFYNRTKRDHLGRKIRE